MATSDRRGRGPAAWPVLAVFVGLGGFAGLIGLMLVLLPSAGQAGRDSQPEPSTPQSQAPVQPTLPTPPASGEAPPPLRRGTVRTLQGGVEAFTAYSIHLLNSAPGSGSPTLDVVAAPDLPAVDRGMVTGIPREQAMTFIPQAGSYRVLGWSGSQSAPDSVMVEVLAPFRYGSSGRWVVMGGVVSWSPQGWGLSSIRPREVPQPAAPPTQTAQPAAPVTVAGEPGWLPAGARS